MNDGARIEWRRLSQGQEDQLASPTVAHKMNALETVCVPERPCKTYDLGQTVIELGPALSSTVAISDTSRPREELLQLLLVPVLILGKWFASEQVRDKHLDGQLGRKYVLTLSFSNRFWCETDLESGLPEAEYVIHGHYGHLGTACACLGVSTYRRGWTYDIDVVKVTDALKPSLVLVAGRFGRRMRYLGL
jgi:hypothetical protein